MLTHVRRGVEIFTLHFASYVFDLYQWKHG